MPRNIWAKVYCDLLRHPRFIGRPDSEVRLWLGLILYAKEYSPERGEVAMSAEAMRQTFGIQAPMSAVRAGLAYLVDAGLLVREGEKFRIRDFGERQGPDSAAERTSRWRDKRRDDHETKRHGNVSTNVSTSSPEVEVEEEKEKKRSSAQGHEGQSTGLVDNPDLSGLSESDKAQVQRLLRSGRAQDAIALLGQVTASKPIRKDQVPEPRVLPPSPAAKGEHDGEERS